MAYNWSLSASKVKLIKEEKKREGSKDGLARVFSQRWEVKNICELMKGEVGGIHIFFSHVGSSIK